MQKNAAVNIHKLDSRLEKGIPTIQKACKIHLYPHLARITILYRISSKCAVCHGWVAWFSEVHPTAVKLFPSNSGANISYFYSKYRFSKAKLENAVSTAAVIKYQSGICFVLSNFGHNL
jgi:hypothetical protein